MAQHGEQAHGLPLKGAVLCSTSIMHEVRTEMAAHAIEMGAVHVLDLTADVTHLIVGEVRTPKYRYVAKARPDIKVLQPGWVAAVKEQWKSGGDVDVAAIEEEHRCPTLAGLHICVTGFTDLEQRIELEETITKLGATYSGDLTKQVTQLIVATPQGAKYTHAKQWNIPCVSLKWLTDSMVRKMALDESLYDPLMPENVQGKDAFVLEVKTNSTLGKRAREDGQQLGEVGKRKFRRTASTRLEGHSQDLWQDISTVGKTANSAASDQWQEVAEQVKHRASTPPNDDMVPTLPTTTKLFSGWRMCLQGFGKSQKEKLRQVLEQQCGATVVDSASQLRLGDAVSHCILIPHHPPEALYYLSKGTADTVVATEWWVERCIYKKTILDTADDALSRPFWTADLPSMPNLSIASTGFNSIDLRQMAAVVANVGACYHEKLEPTTSVLISSSTTVKREKAYYAKKHNIPIVTEEWLWSSIKAKRQQTFEPYRIHLDTQALGPAGLLKPASRSSSDRSGPLQRPRDRRTSSHGPQANAKDTTKRQAPFVHEDNDEDSSVQNMDTSTYIPLKERSPNVSSPTKRSPFKDRQSMKDYSDRVASASIPIDVTGQRHETRQQETAIAEDLNADIASLSHKLLESRSGAVVDTDHPRRKKRTLGRAASAISNRSISISANQSIEERLDLWDDAGQASATIVSAPSTQLGYEVPEAEAHRLQMAKKMGTSFADEHGGTKLASIGTVRDTEGRTRSRRHKA